MLERKWVGCMLGLIVALAGGCAKPVAPEDPNAGAPGNDGPGPGPGTGSSGGSSTPDDGDGDPTDVPPGDGEIPDVPPSGCTGGFSDGRLSLALGVSVPGVRLEAVGGKLVANGTVCTDADGAEVEASALSELEIDGSAANETVILDFGSGDFSGLLGSTESIEVSLASGDNALIVRGGNSADHYLHGMRGGALVLDLAGEGEVTLVGTGVTSLSISLGAGDDRLEGFLAAGSDAQTEPSFSATQQGIGALSIPLVAYGDDGDDWLVGGTNDDEFDGGAGDDSCSGLGGNDIFRASEALDGNDVVNGGADYDQVTYELRTADLILGMCFDATVLGCDSQCECAEPSGEVGESDLLLNVEDLTGGWGNDTLRGTESADSLSGGPGDDHLFGLGGSDLLYGQRGVDALEGGLDGDYCDGQPDEQVTDCEL